MELANALGRRQDDRPLMLMEGDSGQTVRPTGFEWTPLTEMLTEHVSKSDITYLDMRRPRPAPEPQNHDRGATPSVQGCV